MSKATPEAIERDLRERIASTFGDLFDDLINANEFTTYRQWYAKLISQFAFYETRVKGTVYDCPAGWTIFDDGKLTPEEFDTEVMRIYNTGFCGRRLSEISLFLESYLFFSGKNRSTDPAKSLPVVARVDTEDLGLHRLERAISIRLPLLPAERKENYAEQFNDVARAICRKTRDNTVNAQGDKLPGDVVNSRNERLHQELADALGKAVCTLATIAIDHNIILADATRNRFNRVSETYGLPIWL